MAGEGGAAVSAFPSRTAARPAVVALMASPATSHASGVFQAVPTPASSRETPPEAGERARNATEVARNLARAYGEPDETRWAYEDLDHRLMLARERGEEIPCLGPGGEAWTSEDPADQELAADLCLLCPAFALCQRYADLAKPSGGTWAGVTRYQSDRKRRRSADREREERKRRESPNGAAPRPISTAASGPDCRCRCGGRTRGGRYLPGHDSQHLGRLLATVRAGEMTLEAALLELQESPRIQVKLRLWLGV